MAISGEYSKRWEMSLYSLGGIRVCLYHTELIINNDFGQLLTPGQYIGIYNMHIQGEERKDVARMLSLKLRVAIPVKGRTVSRVSHSLS